MSAHKKGISRNKFDALHYILEIECLPALKELAELCKKEKKITQEIKKGSSIKTGYGNLIILKRALICLLCVRIANMYKDKQGISFRDIGVNLKKGKVIQKMIRTRNTWFGHMGKNIDDIISGKEIVESDLENKLKSLSALLTSSYKYPPIPTTCRSPTSVAKD